MTLESVETRGTGHYGLTTMATGNILRTICGE